MKRTYQPTAKEVKRDWQLVDAKGAVLGRLATRVAMMLMGKHKATYSPHMDNGDNVVVVNAEKVKVTGNKEKLKVYRGHSGYPGGFKEISYQKMKAEHPTRIIEHAVKGMLPSNRLLAERMKRLKLVVGEEHPYKNKFN